MENFFLKTWDRPPRFSTMHRPSISRVVGDEIVLNGTTIEEVKQYHRDTLRDCVAKANEARIEESHRNQEKRRKEDSYQIFVIVKSYKLGDVFVQSISDSGKREYFIERKLRMISSRQTSILRELLAAEEPLTSKYLANMIQVTSRTVRNDIKKLAPFLSENGANILSVRGTGYELKIDDETQFRKLLQEIFQNNTMVQGKIPTSPEERVQFLIQRLLLTDDYVKLENLADELYISRSTIQNDLKDVKKTLKDFGIVLDKRPNYGCRIKGDEVKLRFCMSQYLFNRQEAELDMLNSRISILPKKEMVTIRGIILEQIQEHEISLSDVGLNNLIIHIAIAYRRIRNDNHVSLYPEELNDIIHQNEYKVAKNIVRKIEENLEVIFPNNEIAYMTIHLMGIKTIVDTNISKEEVLTLVDDEVYQLTLKILDGVEEKFNIGIKDDKELIVEMSMHLKPAMNRYRYGMNLRNPMLQAIKSHYPLAFEAGILAGIIIHREIGLQIDENEIGYIALHLGAAMERKQISKRPKQCIIVCASGVGSAKLLYYKLQAKFPSTLEILGTTEYYKLNQMSVRSLDFIISTIPISDPLSIPVIEVNTILGESDLNKIENILSEGTEKSFEYTNEELVFLQQPFETKEEVFNFLADKLQTLSLVDQTFIDSVYEREEASPTCFGNLVAIPHPMVPQTDTTFWTVCTLQKPIMWGGKRVQFVCLLSVQKNNMEDLQNMYKVLGKVVDDMNIVQQLLKCKDYQEFIHILKKTI